MTLNDMRSLRQRSAQMSRTALEVAKFLEQHARIDRVHYPGLPSHPAHDLAGKYMKIADSNEHGFGYLMSAEIRELRKGTNDNARRFYDSLDMTYRATDLGRVKTVATLNAISTHLQQGEEGRELASLKPNNCRISVGLEDPADIMADLDQALAKI